MKYVIGNWKAYKNEREALDWIDSFEKLALEKFADKVAIILCPPYPLIPIVKQKLSQNSPIKLASQDISFFHSGSYTGEVSAHTLKGLVDYTLIGHSERRKYFREDDPTLSQKALNTLDFDIIPIYCIRGATDKIPDKVTIIAYEPVHAIGTGQNEEPEVVIKMKTQLTKKPDIYIYGGSVTLNNSRQYLQQDEIDGVLVGGASLKPEIFFGIIESALD